MKHQSSYWIKLLLTLLIVVIHFVFGITTFMMRNLVILALKGELGLYSGDVIFHGCYIVGVCALLIPIRRRLLLALTLFIYCCALFYAPFGGETPLQTAFGLTRMCTAIWVNSMAVLLVQMWSTSYATVLQLLYFVFALGSMIPLSFYANDESYVTYNSIKDQFYAIGIVQAIVSTIFAIVYFIFESQSKRPEEAEVVPLVKKNLNPINSQPNQIQQPILTIALFGFGVFVYMFAQYWYIPTDLKFPDELKDLTDKMNIFFWIRTFGPLNIALLSLIVKPDSIFGLHYVLAFGSLIQFVLFGTNLYSNFIGTALWALVLNSYLPAVLAFVHVQFKLTTRLVVLFALIDAFAHYSVGLFDRFQNGNNTALIGQTIGCLVQSSVLMGIVLVLLRRKSSLFVQ